MKLCNKLHFLIQLLKEGAANKYIYIFIFILKLNLKMEQMNILKYLYLFLIPTNRSEDSVDHFINLWWPNVLFWMDIFIVIKSVHKPPPPSIGPTLCTLEKMLKTVDDPLRVSCDFKGICTQYKREFRYLIKYSLPGTFPSQAADL